MKILVLMPLDEKWSYAATGIYKALPVEVKQKTFAMPMFMEYTRSIGLSPNATYAVFDALATVKSVYSTAVAEDEDLIVIGNCSATYDFDVVFNFQDIDEDLPYEDKGIEKIKEIVKEDDGLMSYVSNLHTAAESTFTLHNCTATADFLTKYLDTDPHLGRLAKEYEKELASLSKELKEKIDNAKEIKGIM